MAPALTEQVALVTGGTRGIGREIARGLAAKGVTTYLAGRSAQQAEAVAAQIAAESGAKVVGKQLNVTDVAACARVVEEIGAAEGRLDILANNAGIAIDAGRRALDIDIADLRETLETNVVGPWQLLQAAVPWMRRNGYGRIVNVSSSLGEIPMHERHLEWPAYGTSKLALNGLTIRAALELEGENILVNSGMPGYCATDMSGDDAVRTPAQGADVMIWLATLPDGGPSGQAFYERSRIAFAGPEAMQEDAPPSGQHHAAGA